MNFRLPDAPYQSTDHQHLAALRKISDPVIQSNSDEC